MAYFSKDDPKPSKIWYKWQKTKAVAKNLKHLLGEFAVVSFRSACTAVLGAVIVNPLSAVAGLSVTGMLSLPVTIPLAIGAAAFSWVKREGIINWNKEAWADISDNKEVKNTVSAAEATWLEKKKAPGFFQKLKAKLSFSKNKTADATENAETPDEAEIKTPAEEITETVMASAPEAAPTERKFQPNKTAKDSFENVANNNDSAPEKEETAEASTAPKKFKPKARNKN